MKEENLISVEELVKRAKKAGVNFGKADPYNRLRYYTKMSLLPHMERRLSKNGKLTANYPDNALAKLLKIEELKLKGLSNEEIQNQLRRSDYSITSTIKNYLSWRNFSVFGVVSVLTLALLNNRGIISLGTEKAQGVDFTNSQAGITVYDSGKAVIDAGKKATFVKSSKVSEFSKINLTFKSSYSPASNYFIDVKVPQEGFVVTLDDQTAEDAEFVWWIVEN